VAILEALDARSDVARFMGIARRAFGALQLGHRQLDAAEIGEQDAANEMRVRISIDVDVLAIEESERGRRSVSLRDGEHAIHPNCSA
jgi:hypothetical protein